MQAPAKNQPDYTPIAYLANTPKTWLDLTPFMTNAVFQPTPISNLDGSQYIRTHPETAQLTWGGAERVEHGWTPPPQSYLQENFIKPSEPLLQVSSHGAALKNLHSAVMGPSNETRIPCIHQVERRAGGAQFLQLSGASTTHQNQSGADGPCTFCRTSCALPISGHFQEQEQRTQHKKPDFVALLTDMYNQIGEDGDQPDSPLEGKNRTGGLHGQKTESAEQAAAAQKDDDDHEHSDSEVL